MFRFWKTLFAAMPLFVAGAVALGAEEDRPNIVLIMADDMGFSDLGCYGGEIDTPHLDALAENGLRFSQFYNTGRCCPTRAALLTGLYPHQAGIGHMTNDLGVPSYQGYFNDRCVTIAEALGPAGYATLISGKWHVGSDPEHWPLRRGFDRFYGVPEGGGFYFQVKKGRSLVLNDDVIEPGDDFYTTDAFTDYAIEFIDEATVSKRPFLLYVPYNAPHWPLQARAEDIERYRGKFMDGWASIRETRFLRQLELGLFEIDAFTDPDRSAPKLTSMTREKRKAMDLRMAVYAAQVHSMDANIGRIVSALKKRDAFENTLILFLSDNGASAEGGQFGFTRGSIGAPTGTAKSYDSYGLAWANASNTPFRKYKSWVHEGGIATPLIAHWPRGIPVVGGWRHQIGHVIDILPTCLEIAGAEYPETRDGKESLPLEGQSLVAAFQDDEIEREPLFFEHQGHRAVRWGRWKLVAAHNQPWELYNIDVDRTERYDLAEVYPDRVGYLAQQWNAFADRAGVLPWPIKRRR